MYNRQSQWGRGDFDSGFGAMYGYQPSAFLQHMQWEANNWGKGGAKGGPPKNTAWEMENLFPGHREGMMVGSCPAWICTNKKCKAVNVTGKPKQLHCRLCASFHRQFSQAPHAPDLYQSPH